MGSHTASCQANVEYAVLIVASLGGKLRGSAAENVSEPVFQALMLFGPFADQKMRQCIAESTHAAEIAKDLIARASDICRAETVSHSLDRDRGTLLESSRLVGCRVFTLGTAWRVTGHSAFRNRIIAELQAVTTFPDWNRTHFIDTAEMMAAAAIGYDWSKDVMTSRQKEATINGIARLGLRPGLESMKGRSGWTTAGTNWTLVCSGGLVIAASLLRKELTTLCDEILDMALPILQSGLDQFDPGGGWPEGPTYGEYGARYAILAYEALRSAGLAHRYPEMGGVLKHWQFERAMTGPSGLMFNTGDSLLLAQRPAVTGWFARNGSGADASAWQWETQAKPHAFDLIWYNPPPAVNMPRVAAERLVFDAGYLTLRKGRNYLAARFGQNRTNHAHLDLGSFVLEFDAQRIVCDLGRGDYASAGYFDPSLRSSHFLTQTRAHNLVFVQEQSLDAEATLILDTKNHMRVAIEIVDPASPVRHLRASQLDEEAAIIADLLIPRQAESPSATWQCFTEMPVSTDEDGTCFGRAEEGVYARLLSNSGETIALSVQPVDQAPPSARRVSATLQIPPDGLFTACHFSRCDHALDLAGLYDWLKEIAQERWRSASTVKQGGAGV